MILLVFVVIFLIYLFVGMGCGLPGSFPLPMFSRYHTRSVLTGLPLQAGPAALPKFHNIITQDHHRKKITHDSLVGKVIFLL